jgi:SAM-dependent methyltransferase
VTPGDMLHLPWPDAAFDAVIDSEAVYCNDFEESCRIYREMHRVTRAGGKLFVRTFATGTWGEGTGARVGPRRYVADDGPLAGKGPSRFTAFDEIPALLGPWQVTSIELVTRSMNARQHTISEWMVEGIKA